MSLHELFISKCGKPPFTFNVMPTRKVGLNYIFKFGKHKGKTFLDVMLSDKQYIRWLYNNGDIEFTKKDEKTIMEMLNA